MAFNIKDKMQGLLQKVTARREEDQQPRMSTLPNGRVSGYVPKVPPRKPQNAPQEHPAQAFGSMVPPGVNPASVPQYMPPMQPAQNAPVPGQQAWGGPTPPQQPYGNQASSQPVPPPQQGTQQQRVFQQPPQQGTQQHAFRHQPQATQQQRTFRQPPMQGTQQQPAQGFPPQGQGGPQQGFPPQGQGVPQPGFAPQGQGGPQQHFPPQAQNVPPQPPVQGDPMRGGTAQFGNVIPFPGTQLDQDGNAYSMTLRVAQITGIQSCYRLLEFMQNNEAVIVNAEQITDTVEANRCLDMLFGAAYAMGQHFERIANRLIYLIVPPHVHVMPFESMLYMSQQDIELRWPGSSRPSASESRRAGAWQDEPAYAAPQRAMPQYGSFGGYASRR